MYLTLWDLKKITACSNAFVEWKFWCFYSDFTEVYSLWFKWQKFSFGDGLVLSRRQAFTWTNGDKVLWSPMLSLCHTALKKFISIHPSSSIKYKLHECFNTCTLLIDNLHTNTSMMDVWGQRLLIKRTYTNCFFLYQLYWDVSFLCVSAIYAIHVHVYIYKKNR